MNLYDVYLSIHVFGAVAWVGGATFAVIVSRRAFANAGREVRRAHAGELVFLGKRFFGPMSLLTLIFGLIAVADGPASFSDPWLGAGFLILLISSAIGGAFFSPQSAKLNKQFEDGEDLSAPAVNRIQNILRMQLVDMTLLYVAVFLMVAKPG